MLTIERKPYDWSPAELQSCVFALKRGEPRKFRTIDGRAFTIKPHLRARRYGLHAYGIVPDGQKSPMRRYGSMILSDTALQEWLLRLIPMKEK